MRSAGLPLPLLLGQRNPNGNASNRRSAPEAPSGSSSITRERCRLAALIGDTDAAIEAYRHYLVLHDDGEPRLAGEVARVGSELARLTGESGPRNS